MKPQVTVVMAVFNDAEYVGRAIDTVLEQTLEDFELLVVDDGSTDDSGSVVRASVAARAMPDTFSFRLIRHPANLGYGAVTNTGLREARADWITFVDADDTVEPQYLERLLAAAADRNAQLVVPRLRAVDECGHFSQLRQWFPAAGVSSGTEAVRRSVQGELVESQHVLIARSIWAKLEASTDNAYSDLIFLLQVFGRCERIAYLDEPLYNYTIRAGSVTGSLRPSVWDLIKLQDYIRPAIDSAFETAEAAILHRHFKLQMLWQLLQKAASEPTASQLRTEVTTWVRQRIRWPDVGWLVLHKKSTLAASFAIAKLSPDIHRRAYERYTRLKHSVA